MMKKTWERNTQGIQEAARRKREQSLARVNAVIDALLRAKAPVNFNTVAQEAKVTKAYLYKEPLLHDRIAALREQQQEQQVRQQVAHAQAKTDATKDLVILAKERRIRELEGEVRQLKAENQQLKRDLQIAHGQLYDRL